MISKVSALLMKKFQKEIMNRKRKINYSQKSKLKKQESKNTLKLLLKDREWLKK